MRRFIVLFCCLLTWPGLAQELHFLKPVNLKQLPSSESYNIMQDKLGYIWFSTEAGLCRYNGNSVKVFTAKEGLPEAATYNVLEDRKGELLVTTSRNRVLKLNREADCFVETPFSKACETFFKTTLQEVYLAKVDSSNSLWLSSQYTTLKVNLRTEKIDSIGRKDSSYYFLKVIYGQVLPVKIFKNPPAITQLYRNKALVVAVERNGTIIHIPLKYSKPNQPSTRLNAVCNKKGELFIAVESTLIRVNRDNSWKIVDVGNPLLNLFSDKDDGLWLATHKGGIIYYPNALNDNYRITSLADVSVTGFCEDSENGIWCTTLEKGVLYCRNKCVLDYSNIPGLNKRADFLKVTNNNLFTSSEKNDLFEFHKDSLFLYHVTKPMGIGLTDIIYWNERYYITSKEYTTSSDLKFKKVSKIPDGSSILGGSNELSPKDGSLFSITRGNLFKINKDAAFRIIPILKSPGKCLLYSHSEGLLLGCADGIYKVDTLAGIEEKIPGLNASITKMLESTDNSIWIATKEKGLYILKNRQLKKLDQLPTDRISDMTFDGKETMWLATNIGLINIRPPFTRQHVQVYNSLHGINSDEISRVAVWNNKVFVSTYEGLCSFPLSCELVNLAAPRIYINNITVNGKQIDLGKRIELTHFENSLKIDYDILTFKQDGQPQRLFYRLQGGDNISHALEGHELLLNNMAPGNYNIVVYGLNSDGKSSTQPAVVNFRIKSPLWKTPLFITGVVLLLIALMFFIVNAIIARIQRKEEEKTRVNKLLAEYQMSALRAQMNPHFIFNCINSIQRYIITNKAEEAYGYLSKFSKLIRLVLNYAEENLISLREEMEIVELYIELEQLRFENKFTYKIEISENIDVNELGVPVMILQPYIENAIWHGLMNLEKGKTGEIRIKMNYDDNILKIEIEDNGIGLERSASLRKKDHKSKGTEINSRRTEILSIMSSSEKGNVIIENIIGENNEIKGTRVVINIPQNNGDE